MWKQVRREFVQQIAYAPFQYLFNFLASAALAGMIYLFTTYNDWWWPYAGLTTIAVFVVVITALGFHKHGPYDRGRRAVGWLLLGVAGLLFLGSLASGFAGYTMLWGAKSQEKEKATPQQHTGLRNAETAPPQVPSEPSIPKETSQKEARVAYTERDVREMLDGLTDSTELVQAKIAPVLYRIQTLSVNWQEIIPNQGLKGLSDQLRELQKRLKSDVWDTIDKFVYQDHVRHEEQMRTAFALDHEAAKGELTRTLQVTIDAVNRLPDNPSRETALLVAPQFTELAKQSDIAYQWLLLMRGRMAEMIQNLRTKNVTGYEK